MEFYSPLRKKEIQSFFTIWMHPEGIKPDRERQILLVITSLWNLEKNKNKNSRGWGMEYIVKAESKGTDSQLWDESGLRI